MTIDWASFWFGAVSGFSASLMLFVLLAMYMANRPKGTP